MDLAPRRSFSDPVYGETVMAPTEGFSAARTARTTVWKRRLAWTASIGGILGIALLVRTARQDAAAVAQAPVRTASAPTGEAPLPRVGRPEHDVMALINGQDISRQRLIEACVRRFGEEVLESLVNKRLITNHCSKRGIEVTQAEIAAEVDRMAKRFQLGREQWLEMLQKERGISPQQYARDIVWPTLALRKLAGESLEVSAEEIDRAYQREYGEMVRARLIAVSDLAKAQSLQAKLAANPADFARTAIEVSEDVNSASVGGLIQPIRHFMGDPQIEQAAFRLQPGEVSPVISLGNQHILLKCDDRIPAKNVSLAQVQTQIVEAIKDEKLRATAHERFGELQASATIVNVYNDANLRDRMPGVVATVNGDRITLKELGDECLLRHGEEVLEVEISQVLLEQALKRSGLQVTDADLEGEMRHAAELAGVVDQRGDADLKRWVEMVVAEQNVTEKQYLQDSVWPSAALKKIAAANVTVSEEDVRKGYEANYGSRVRCRAIVLGNMRRAQEVWDKARRNQSLDYFGDLAEEYSIEPTSKALRGEVPPLQRHGGQPQLEQVAFQLQEGELSGIVQVGDKFVILRCEGRTQRIDVDEDQVRDLLVRDIYEKKLRIAMSEKFEEIRAKSRIDNYLAGTSTGPPAAQTAAGQPMHRDEAVRPTATR
jgi:parvulin-like peptidyl-prolyl isomerase